MKKYNNILTIFIFYLLIYMVIAPKFFISQAFNGISAWALNVLPSILPFMVFSKILFSLGKMDKLSRLFKKPCKALFNSPPISSYVFFTSIISGYPVGAKMTADLYENGKITRSEAYRMISFCSTSGPMFIIGALGANMLKNSALGYMIFVSHVIGAILNGILYRKITTNEETKKVQENEKKSDLSTIIIDSALSIISVGVIICIFFVIISALSPIFNLFPPYLSAFFEGLVEITKGCIDLSVLPCQELSAILCTFIISFGGISTIIQSQTMLSRLKMPIKLFILQKLTHAIFATLIMSLFSLII